MKYRIENGLDVVAVTGKHILRNEHWIAIVLQVILPDLSDVKFGEIFQEMATPTHPGKFDKLLLSEPVQSRMQEALKDIKNLCESYVSLLGNPLLRFGIFSNINWQFERYHNQSILVGEFESLLIFFFFFFFKRVLRVRAY